MAISWGAGDKSIEDFLEEDLPFLIKSHYEDTINLLEKELTASQLTLVQAISRYPNLLLKIRYQIFFWFAQQMSTVQSQRNEDFYSHYSQVAKAYQKEYIYSFVKQQSSIIQEHIVTGS